MQQKDIDPIIGKLLTVFFPFKTPLDVKVTANPKLQMRLKGTAFCVGPGGLSPLCLLFHTHE